MIQDLVPPTSPILIQTAKPIPKDEIKSSSTKHTIEKMLAASHGRRRDMNKPLVVGLAAPQIGISKRIIAVDLKADGKGGIADLQLFINPEITWRSEEQEEWYEGCWSTDRVCGIVSRPRSVRVKAFTKDDAPFDDIFHGYVARIFQHEMDHLNGIEFVSHITDDEKLHWVEPDEFPQYRNNQAWRTWPKKCPRETWEKIKGIR